MSLSVHHLMLWSGERYCIMQSNLNNPTTVTVEPAWDSTLSAILPCRIPNLSNNDNRLIENLKIVWQAMNIWSILFILAVHMAHHLGDRKREAQKALNDECHILSNCTQHVKRIRILNICRGCPKDILSTPFWKVEKKWRFWVFFFFLTQSWDPAGVIFVYLW